MRFLISFVFLFTFHVADALADVDAANGTCREIAKKNSPEIEIYYNYGQVEYDFGKSRNDLGKLNEKFVGQYKSNLNGLTLLMPTITIEGLDLRTEPSEVGNTCFFPVRAIVKIKYQPKVYIAEDLKKGSCSFEVTLRHEQTHLDIGKNALDIFVKSLKNELSELISSVAVEKVADNNAEATAYEINDDYQKQVMGLWHEFLRDLNAKHSELDKRLNYVREKRLCDK